MATKTRENPELRRLLEETRAFREQLEKQGGPTGASKAEVSKITKLAAQIDHLKAEVTKAKDIGTKAIAAKDALLMQLEKEITELKANGGELKTRVANLTKELASAKEEVSSANTLNYSLSEQVKAIDSIFSTRSLITIAVTAMTTLAFAAMIL